VVVDVVKRCRSCTTSVAVRCGGESGACVCWGAGC
jgi:hypothetical protein